MNQYHKIMEKFWLAVAIVSLVFAVYKFGQVGYARLGEVAIYFLFPFLAGFLFYARYFIRKRAERENKNED
ncbi:MAG: hypothetical protein Salg2KO_05630 [Salibacteraceae bacterium]